LEQFRDAFEGAARQDLAGELLTPPLEIDAQLDFPAIGMALARELEVLQPFGVGNPEPVFMTATAEVCERKVFSAGVRYRLRQAGQVMAGVIFGVGDEFPGIPGEIVDVAYRLSTNEWNGMTSVELKIADLRPSGPPENLPSSF
jgi:single-stranded-DNA-specific exonuclease